MHRRRRRHYVSVPSYIYLYLIARFLIGVNTGLLHAMLLHTHVDCCVSAKECNGPMAVQRLQPTTSNDGISDGFLFILDPKDKCRDCCKHFRPNTCSGTGTQLVHT